MKTFQREIAGIYLWAVLLVLPLLYHDRYVDLIDWKAGFFRCLAGIFLCCGVVALIGGAVAKRSAGIPLSSPRKLLAGMSFLDAGMLAFGIAIFLSFVTSMYSVRNVFLGDIAQFVGAGVLLAVVLSYFLLSRFAESAKKSYIAAFYISSVLVLSVGLLNHMLVDPLGMHRYESGSTLYWMASTIGNVDYYYAYLAIVLSFFAAYRMDMERSWQTAAVDVLLVICYMNLWTARSSGIYVGLLFGLFVLVLFGITSFARLRGLCWNGVLAGCGGLLAEVGAHIKPDLYYGIENEVSGRFQLHHFWLPFGLVCATAWLVMGKIHKIGNDDKVMAAFCKAGKPLAAFSALAMAALEGMVLFYRPLQDITGRTFIWDDMKAGYAYMTVREKLLGVGPGCLDLFLIQQGFYGFSDTLHLTAHNEVFEYWYLTGILGAAAYLAVVVAFFGSLYQRIFGELSSSSSNIAYFREMCCCGAAFAAYLGAGLTNGPYIPNIVVAYTMLAMFRRYQIPDEEVLFLA